MSKYIDKDELWERLRKRMVHHIVTNTLFNTIKAVIDGMPTIEVSEDCISREYLKSFAYINKGDFNSVETIREWIDNAPSVIPTQNNAIQHVESVESVGRAEGEWVFQECFDEHYGRAYECELCGVGVVGKHNYCPNCGAKMRLE